MAKKPTTPIKVTAHLLDGRVNSADGLLMLDAILYHAWFLRHAPHVLEGLGADTYDGHMGLPLRRLPGGRYAASRGIYRQEAETIEYINKRPDFFAADKQDRLALDKGLVSSSIGVYRAYRIPQYVRTITGGEITWYAMGHGNEVLSLLGEMRAVGKKPAAGYGIVADWTVEDVPEDYSLWHPEHGLMRPLPVGESAPGDVSRYPVLQYGIRPPYWKPVNARLCYVPEVGV